MSNRSSTGRPLDQMIWANISCYVFSRARAKNNQLYFFMYPIWNNIRQFQIRQATYVSLSLQSLIPWLMYSFICDPCRYFVRLKLLFPFTFLMSSYLQLGKLEFILARPFPRENKLSPQNPTLSPTYFPFPALKTYNFYILGIQFLPRGNDFHRRSIYC